MSYEPPAPEGARASNAADLVAGEWRRRTQAEYSSAAIAHQVTLWLIQEGGPPDLIRDGLRIVEDELSHSELSAVVMGASGGSCPPPVIDAPSLVLPGAHNPRQALVSAITRFFCVGETVAVPLFRMLRAHSSVPVARRALDRVMRDEVRHRQFGWDVLDWLLLTDAESVRGHVALELPSVWAEMTRAYGAATPPHESHANLEQDVTAWGLAARAQYAETLSAALDRDVVPRFAARDIEAPAPNAPLGGVVDAP